MFGRLIRPVPAATVYPLLVEGRREGIDGIPSHCTCISSNYCIHYFPYVTKYHFISSVKASSILSDPIVREERWNITALHNRLTGFS
jgi:hypothetical protein